MVKKRVIIFLSAVMLSLLVAPAVNIFSAANPGAIKWREKSFLYNMDFGVKWVSRSLYPFGISINPKQVVIGRDAWLYLGDSDEHQQTLTVDRRSSTEADTALGRQIGDAAQAWDRYLSIRGVKLFRVMVGPNKGTIYPEHLPAWAKPPSSNVTDALFAGTGNARYIDLRKPLLAAKAAQPEALYYKVDTHWNSLGAGIAFRAFARQVAESAPELRWPPETTYQLSRVNSKAGGDLARLLRFNGDFPDTEPVTRLSDLPIKTIQSDFHTQQIICLCDNPMVGVSVKPLLVKAEGALNKRKVLWVRDSFGSAMSPWMAATFSEVLQLNLAERLKSPERFVQLIDEFKPDYVFFTIVERNSRAEVFTAYPPKTTSSKH
jgi:alginate O-acetyltransferase complex protein AlgJ